MSPALCSTWSCAAHIQLWYSQHCTSLWCDLGPALEMAVSVYVAVEYMVGLPTKMAQDCWACRTLENTLAIQGQLLALCSLRLILVTLLLVHGQFLHLTDHCCCIVGLLKCKRENSNDTHFSRLVESRYCVHKQEKITKCYFLFYAISQVLISSLR